LRASWPSCCSPTHAVWRACADGALIPLAEQERHRWNRDDIREGSALIARTLTRATLGPYQIQAAIAAVHDEAVSAEETDWPQILALYRLLERLAPGPMVALNRAVALAMARGPEAGLAVLDELDADERLRDHHRLAAVRAHLLECVGDLAGARQLPSCGTPYHQYPGTALPGVPRRAIGG
jgi:predicted RNA polymerase sigma factor